MSILFHVLPKFDACTYYVMMRNCLTFSNHVFKISSSSALLNSATRIHRTIRNPKPNNVTWVRSTCWRQILCILLCRHTLLSTVRGRYSSPTHGHHVLELHWGRSQCSPPLSGQRYMGSKRWEFEGIRVVNLFSALSLSTVASKYRYIQKECAKITSVYFKN